MKRRLLALLLALTLTLALAVPALGATYTDLEGHWAKSYMEDLASKGYLAGYEDGTMRPNGNITICEALVFLSRFYSPDTEAMTQILADKQPVVESAVESSLTWAYDELSVCLAAGIITEAELRAVELRAAIEKDLLAVFLVRAMGQEEAAQALSDTKLSFSDADAISPSRRGYVAWLVDAGIVEGDTQNNFSPKMNVTRAIVATMVSRALTYIQEHKLDLTIDDYEGIVRTAGVIYAADSGTLQLRQYDGLVREYAIASTTKVTVNDTVRTLSSLYAGCPAEVVTRQGVLTSVAIESVSGTSWVQGTLSSTYPASGRTAPYIYLRNADTGLSTRYSIPTSASLEQDGKAVNFSGLTKGSFVTLCITSGTVTEVIATSGETEISGTVAQLTYGATVTLKVTDAEGTRWCFYMDISNLPPIYRGQTRISIDRLNTGDTVKAEISGGSITGLLTEGSETTVEGQITAITETTAGTSWIITEAGGTAKTFALDKMAGCYKGNDAILLSDVHVGDTVSVVVYGSTIVEVYLESSMQSSTKLSGTTLTADASSRTITLLSDGKLVYLSLSGGATMIAASTGRSISLTSLPVNASLVAYGSYTSSTSFTATSIVVESA